MVPTALRELLFIGVNFLNYMLQYHEQIRDPRWKKLADTIRDRAENKCESCGRTGVPLHIHHLYYVPEMLAWEYEEESLKAVCRHCHNALTFDFPKLSGLIAWEILIGKRRIP